MLQNVLTVTGVRTAPTDVVVSVAGCVTKSLVVRPVTSLDGQDLTVMWTLTSVPTHLIIAATTPSVTISTARSVAPVCLGTGATSTSVSVS